MTIQTKNGSKKTLVVSPVWYIGLFKSVREPLMFLTSQYGETKLSTSYKIKEMHFLLGTKVTKGFLKWWFGD